MRNIADGSQYFLGHVQRRSNAAGTECSGDEIAGLYYGSRQLVSDQGRCPGGAGDVGAAAPTIMCV